MLLSRCSPTSLPLLTQSQVDKLISRSKVNTFTAGVQKMDGGERRSFGRRSTLTWLRDCEEGYEDIFGRVNAAMQDAADGYKFKIDNVYAIQLTTYDKFQYYRWHYDNAVPGDTRLLSISIELQHATVGGGIEFLPLAGQYWQGHEHCGKIGAATIFPTYLIHQAKPVWLGTRISAVAWAYEKER